MKDKKEVKIKYKSAVVREGSGDEVFLRTEYDYVCASTSHVKRFNNALMLLMGIDGCERNLMDWIADNMTSGNYISNNETTRQNFIKFHEKYKKLNNRSYSEKTVSIAFQRLDAAGLLIKKNRGLFMVNPICYYAGNETDRVDTIRMIMEFQHGTDTKLKIESK